MLDYLAMADDTAAVLRSHGVTRGVFAGLSMGSGIIQALAVRHPDLVAGGVLGALGRIDRTVLAESGELPPAVRATLVEGRLPTDDEVRETAAFVFSARTRRERPELIEASYERLRQHDWASAASRGFTADGLSSVDPALIAAPMVVLVGAEDRAVPLQHVRDLAAALPDAELFVLEDVGHAVLTEAVDAMAAAVDLAVAKTDHDALS